MSTNVNWPVIGGSTYSVPAAGEVNWANLSDFLVALGNVAQGVGPQKIATRIATTTPVTVASSTDCVVVSDLAVAGAVAVNLPAGVEGQYFMVADGKGDASTNNITITPNGAETIQGAANVVISANRGAVVIVFRGTNWYIVAEFSSFSTGFIPRAKIAAATPNYVVVNDGSGFLSEEQYLSTTKGGTGITSTATFPSTGTIVTRTSTDTGADRLQNKDLDDDTTGFVDSADTTKRLEVETSGSTTGTTTTVSSASTVSRNITLPDADTVLVGRDTVDTGADRLTTKDLEASTVRFVDATDTTKTLGVDLSANAAGADTVIADTATADRTVTLQDGSYTVVGRDTTDTLTNKALVDTSTSIVDSVDATKTILFDAGGTTGTSSTITAAQTANRVLTLPDATTELVGDDAQATLTNKDYDGGVATDLSRLTLPGDTLADITALTRKAGTLIYGTDTTLAYLDNGTILTPLSGGGGGSSSINIRGSEGAGTTTLTAGDNHNQRFNLTAARTVVLPAAGVSSGDVWQMVNPNGFTLSIQADDASLILTSWGDQVSLVALTNTPATNSDWAVVEKTTLFQRTWTSYTPAIVGDSGPTAVSFFSRRNGPNLEIYGSFTVGTASGASPLEIDIISGVTIDSSGIVSNRHSFGTWHQLQPGGGSDIFGNTNSGVCEFVTGMTTSFRLAFQTSSNNYTTDVASSYLTNGNPVNFPLVSIPIAEWAEI